MARFANLEGELVRAGLNKSELALYLGISTGSISAKFTGATEFKLAEMERIRDRLSGDERDLTLDYLFKRDE